MSFSQGLSIAYSNVEETPVFINIYDTLSPEGDTVFINLEGSEEPCHVATTDNDEEKFTVFKAKRLLIKFLSTAQVNLLTFIDSTNTRWYVEKIINNQIVFKGFLAMDDLQENFLDPDSSNEVSLTAIDGLGTLKDLPLLESYTNQTPKGYFNLITYIAWALARTGLSLPINIISSIKEESSPDKIAFESCYLHSKTFEKEIGESEDCYTVLQKILGEDCEIFQSKGEWWIRRVDALQGDDMIIFQFDANGKNTGQSTGNFQQRIHPDLDLFFTNMVTFVKYQQRTKIITETFNYDTPRELLDNLDFTRGETIIPLGGPDWAAFKLDDWIMRPGFSFSVNTITSQAFIKRVYFEGYEKERYLVLTPQTNANANSNHVESNPVYVGAKDKFTVSVDYRFPNAINDFSQSVFIMTARIKCEDGTYYWLGKVDGVEKWVRAAPEWATNSIYSEVFLNFNDPFYDEKEWQTLTWNAPPCPAAGEVYVTLHAMNTRADFTEDNTDIHYQNLRFEYTPYINGSYQKYKAQTFSISQDIGTKAYDATVYVSDSPRRLFKGALHIQDGWETLVTANYLIVNPKQIILDLHLGDVTSLFTTGQRFQIIGSANNPGIFTVVSSSFDGSSTIVTVLEETVNEGGANLVFQKPKYNLAGRFFDQRSQPGLPPEEFLHPFGHIQAYSVWNQNNRTFRIFDFQLQGLNNGNDMPDALHLFTISENSPHTLHKFFMLSHFDIDTRICEWQGLMIEVFDNTIGKEYAAPITFKYITERN